MDTGEKTDPNVQTSHMMMYKNFCFHHTEDIRKTFKYFFTAEYYSFNAPPLVTVLMTYPTSTHAKDKNNSSKDFSALFIQM